MTNESLIRLALFFSTFGLLAIWEIAAPRRAYGFKRRERWFTNISLSVLNQLCLRLFFPVLAVGLAVLAQQRGWGLFNAINMPGTIAAALCFLAFDLGIYVQHLLFHRFEWLWRLHRVHHTDLDFDVTTAIRFHPVEIILSMLIKMVVVVLLGAPPISVLLFEVVLSLTALFNHSNIIIPPKLEQLLRLWLVTPDMHRVHHSAEPLETNSNFGFNLPWWDYMFNTYCAQPNKGHKNMTVGLLEYQREEELALPKLLLQPFTKQ